MISPEHPPETITIAAHPQMAEALQVASKIDDYLNQMSVKSHHGSLYDEDLGVTEQCCVQGTYAHQHVFQSWGLTSAASDFLSK
jgi:DNA-directed RNA polymerase subunit N (RpoN/RPB10)